MSLINLNWIILFLLSLVCKSCGHRTRSRDEAVHFQPYEEHLNQLQKCVTAPVTELASILLAFTSSAEWHSGLRCLQKRLSPVVAAEKGKSDWTPKIQPMGDVNPMQVGKYDIAWKTASEERKKELLLERIKNAQVAYAPPKERRRRKDDPIWEPVTMEEVEESWRDSLDTDFWNSESDDRPSTSRKRATTSKSSKQTRQVRIFLRELASETGGGMAVARRLDLLAESSVLDRDCYVVALRACGLQSNQIDIQGEWALMFLEDAEKVNLVDTEMVMLALRACARSSDWAAGMQVLDLAKELQLILPRDELEALLLCCAVAAQGDSDGAQGSAWFLAQETARIMLDQGHWLKKRSIHGSSNGGLDVVFYGVPAAPAVFTLVKSALQEMLAAQLQAGPTLSIVDGDLRLWLLEPQLLFDDEDTELILAQMSEQDEQESPMKEWHSILQTEHGSTENFKSWQLASTLQTMMAKLFDKVVEFDLSDDTEVPTSLLQAVGMYNVLSQPTADIITVGHLAVEDWVRKECLAVWNPVADSLEAQNAAAAEKKVREDLVGISKAKRGQLSSKREKQLVQAQLAAGGAESHEDFTEFHNLTVREVLSRAVRDNGDTRGSGGRNFGRGISDEDRGKGNGKGGGKGGKLTNAMVWGKMKTFGPSPEELAAQVALTPGEQAPEIKEMLKAIMSGEQGMQTVGEVSKSAKKRNAKKPKVGYISESSRKVNDLAYIASKAERGALDGSIYIGGNLDQTSGRPAVTVAAALEVDAQRKAEAKKLPKDLGRNPDISVLPGVGPKTADKLRAADLYTFQALADAVDDEVKSIAEEHKLPKKRLKEWIETARTYFAERSR